MSSILVGIKEPRKDIRFECIEPTLDNFHKLIDKDNDITLEGVMVDSDLVIYIDDEGKLNNREPNFTWLHGDYIAGTAVFVGVGYGGEDVSLTEFQMLQIQVMLELRRLPKIHFR